MVPPFSLKTSTHYELMALSSIFLQTNLFYCINVKSYLGNETKIFRMLPPAQDLKIQQNGNRIQSAQSEIILSIDLEFDLSTFNSATLAGDH
jgi:hypothetical protein